MDGATEHASHLTVLRTPHFRSGTPRALPYDHDDTVTGPVLRSGSARRKEQEMKRVAIVVSSVGYHWEELFAAYDAFEEAGLSIDLYTVDGAPPRPDPLSIKKSALHALGLGVSPRIAPDTTKGTALRARLLEVMPVAKLDVIATEALYLPGGHGCLFDVNRSDALHSKIAALYTRGALLSAVCHATSTFAFVKVDGASIIQGHALTGFPNPLDQTLIRLGMVHPEFLPIPLINDDELRRAGAELSKADVVAAMVNPRTMRISLPFITGVGPKAAARVAETVVHHLMQDHTRPMTPRETSLTPHHVGRIQA